MFSLRGHFRKGTASFQCLNGFFSRQKLDQCIIHSKLFSFQKSSQALFGTKVRLGMEFAPGNIIFVKKYYLPNFFQEFCDCKASDLEPFKKLDLKQLSSWFPKSFFCQLQNPLLYMRGKIISVG
jgi:hypothetical protein